MQKSKESRIAILAKSSFVRLSNARPLYALDKIQAEIVRKIINNSPLKIFDDVSASDPIS
ncbi:hypothetical protein QV07_07080 [Gallibacterium genomosp. 3]|uniref:Uncharacterized protein n=1 Tax=Gallibacterium genomosp. 3 TaxID=505345 RepID=A0A1A7Q1U1_9PAST|nr:hypothetical protein QV07_07080 [Gallibacterium genomosp. 3]